MNRAQRRSKKTKQKHKEAVNNAINQGIKIAISNSLVSQTFDRSMCALMGAPLIVLRDKYGFGKKRLAEFLDAMLFQIQCVQNGQVTLEELKQIILEETGLDVNKLMGYTTVEEENDEGRAAKH